MKLILIRHAKSSWDDFTLDDHDRPLNDRGQRSAAAIGQWLAERGHIPRQIACSTAARARETCDYVCQSFETIEPTFEEGLYHASFDRILRQINKSPDGDLMIIGHNPGFAETAGMLAGSRPADDDFNRYPTCATAVFDFDVDRWRDAKAGQGVVLDFTTPRALT